MPRPRWDAVVGWARGEADRHLAGGRLPRPTLLLFEGDDPTLYVRAGARYVGTRPEADPWQELFALGYVLRPERAAITYPLRLRTDADGALSGEAEGEAGIGVEWVRRRDGGRADHAGAVLTYGLDDAGEVAWERADPFDDGGPMQLPLTTIVTGLGPPRREGGAPVPVDLGVAPAELAYALTRFGLTIGVDRAWRTRYGLDRPIDPREVRRVDRRRARALRDRTRAVRS